MFDSLSLSWFAGQAGAWLLTYALHSTLLLGLAWLVSRRLAGRSIHIEETVWRCALVGSLLTASLQVAAGREPVAGRWNLDVPAEMASVATPTVAPAVPKPAVARASRPLPAFAPQTRSTAARLEAAAAGPAAEMAAPRRTAPVSLPQALLGVWLGGALLLSLGYAGKILHLRRRLENRPRVIGGGIFQLLSRLSEQAGFEKPIRFSSSTRLPIPVALGMRRPEICVPPRAFSLTSEQQEALLAHELGHLVRNDPFWLAFSQILTRVLFFQPLNWIAAARLREISELLCDEWAVERTGRPLSLARCLTEVAGWSFPAARLLPAPGMADRPSHLAHRIRRLLEEARSPQRTLHRGWLTAGLAVALVAVVAAAPGVSAVRAAAAPESPAALAASDEQEAPEPPEAPEISEPGDELDDLAEMQSLEAAEDHAESIRDAVEDAKDSTDLEDYHDVIEEVTQAFSSPEMVQAWAEAGQSFAELGQLGNLAVLSEEDLNVLSEKLQLSDEELQAISERAQLSEEEIAEISRNAEAMAAHMATLGPKMEKLQAEMDRKMAALDRQMPTPEMKALEAEMEAISERIESRQDPEAEKRFEAEVERLAADGFTKEEKEEIGRKARELAAQIKPSDADLARIRELAAQHRELSRKFMDEHRDEIEAMRKEAREQAQAMREETRRRMSEDRRLQGEQRKEKQHERQELRQRDRERLQKDRQERERKAPAPATPPTPAR